VVEIRRGVNQTPTSAAYKQYAWDLRYIDAPVCRWWDGDRDGQIEPAAGEMQYFTNDGNFNTTALIDANSGAVVERYQYDPYGRPTVLNGASGAEKDPNVSEWTPDADNKSDWDNDILYCGYQYDPVTGLYHVRNRYYNWLTGRWQTTDPAGYVDGVNIYAYCVNNPLRYTDTSGARPIDPSGEYELDSQGRPIGIANESGRTLTGNEQIEMNRVLALAETERAVERDRRTAAPAPVPPPAPAPATPPAFVPRSFSDYAIEKMEDLYSNHSHQTGSRSGETGKAKTDCITYVMQVLVYAFQKVSDEQAAQSVRQKANKGTELAAYLVREKGWKAYYWNPDICNRATNDENISTYNYAKKYNKYYYGQTPLSALRVNYQPIPGSTEVKNDQAWAELSKIEFGFGSGGGGVHTWLFRRGDVYEVHWSERSDSPTLYEKSSLRNKAPNAKTWGSGIIVTPP
jgi:RHS repeat-associated protein